MSNPRLSSAHQRPSLPTRILRGTGEFLRALLQPLRRDLLGTGLLVAAIALIVLFFSLLGSLRASDQGTPTSLSRINQLAQSQAIVRATLLDADHRIQARLRDGTLVRADYPSSDSGTQELMRTLQARGASVVIDPQAGKPTRSTVVQFLLPILILVCLFAFFTRLGQQSDAGGLSAFSSFGGRASARRRAPRPRSRSTRSRAPARRSPSSRRSATSSPIPPSTSRPAPRRPRACCWSVLRGRARRCWRRPRLVRLRRRSSRRRVRSSWSRWWVLVRRVLRDLFAKARKAAPAIIFIDEIDAAGRKRGAGVGQGNDEREQTLNQMLVEMDGFGGDAGIIVMGATNRPDILDPALLRPGRFDRQIVIDVPDVHGRLEILNLHARGRRMADDVDLHEISKMCPGFSGAELANLMNEAALLTVREGRDTIDQATLEEAIDRVIAGPAKKHILTDLERSIIATHEAGHAVVSRALGQVTAMQKLSIVARGRQMGTAATMLTDKDAVMLQRGDLERQLAVLLSGTVAELLAFGEESTGISEDIHAATNLARQMVTSYGMSRRLGHVTIGEPAGEVFLGAALQDLGSTGPKALDVIDDEVERFVREAEWRAEVALRENWSVVDATARALLDQETLSGVALEAMLGAVRTVEAEALVIPADLGAERDEHDTPGSAA